MFCVSDHAVQGDAITDRQRLFHAVRHGRVREARIILEVSDGVLDAARDEWGHTLLIIACYIADVQKRKCMVDMLLDRYPEVNRRDLKGRTALSHACELGCCDVIQLLIHQSCIDPDAVDFKGNTPLIYGARHGQAESLKLLAQNFRRLGLKVDQRNQEGLTALLIAAKYGHIECCRALVHIGKASVSLRDKHRNMLPLEYLREHMYDFASTDFLQPKKKFYRVAKLATSLAKAKLPAPLNSVPIEKALKRHRSLTLETLRTSGTDKNTTRGSPRRTPRRGKSFSEKGLKENSVYARSPLASSVVSKEKSCPSQAPGKAKIYSLGKPPTGNINIAGESRDNNGNPYDMITSLTSLTSSTLNMSLSDEVCNHSRSNKNQAVLK